MRQTKGPKSSEKKKRFSESKPSRDFQPRFSPYHANHGHNRSESIGPKKPFTRFHTDYEQRPQILQQKLYRKTYYSNQRTHTQSIGYKYSHQEKAIHSTKSNPRKNLELRLLFNKTKQSDEIKGRNKGYTAHHPLLKYVGYKHPVSPYTTQIQRLQSLYTKMKSSTSKHKRTPSGQAPQQRERERGREQRERGEGRGKGKGEGRREISLNKQQIKIGNKGGKIESGQPQQSQPPQQETVKTIKKTTEQQQRAQNTSKSHYSERSQHSDEGYGLTEQEEEIFGDRFPFGFQKVKLLGRGGFSLVWLGKHIKSGKQFAVKQIITQNTHQTHIKEIWFGTNFFTLGGIPKPQFAHLPGIKNLVRMYSYEINQSDTWIFYEKCGDSLGSNLYDIKSEKVYGDQRLYKIYYKPFYQSMAYDQNLLKKLIIEICKPLAVLSQCEIVHSDLKTQNILIRYQHSSSMREFKLTEVKLIDYGSSFQFKNIAQFSMATPQYMPPEILNYIIHENEGEYEEDLYQEVMNNYRNPWIVDMFSLGCVLLEIVVGVPLWMSLPLLVPSKTGTSYCQKQGLFAVKGRLFPEIIQKQRKVIARLDEILTHENYSKISISAGVRKAIKGMLSIDFNQRISPQQVIKILEEQIGY